MYSATAECILGPVGALILVLLVLLRYREKPVSDRSYWLSILLGRAEIIEDLEFHVSKGLFMTTHDLPLTFSFAEYLRVCMARHVVEQLEVKPRSW